MLKFLSEIYGKYLSEIGLEVFLECICYNESKYRKPIEKTLIIGKYNRKCSVWEPGFEYLEDNVLRFNIICKIFKQFVQF